MFNVRNALSLFVFGIMLMWTGCTNNTITDPGTGSTADKDAITRMIQSDSLGEMSRADEDIINDRAPIFDDGIFAKSTTAIKPIRWGREILSVTRNVDVTVTGDTIAMATITKMITGNLIISATHSDTAQVADTILVKPFTEQVQRKMLFHRIVRPYWHHDDDEGENEHDSDKDGHRGWIPVAVTLVEGKTQPESNNLFTITSLELNSPSGKDTITDPLDTWLRFRREDHCIPNFVTGDSVTVRVIISSTDPDTECAVLRYKGPRFGMYSPLRNRRIRMHLISSVGSGGTFERTYEARLYAGLDYMMPIGRFHAAVDVVSRGTLYDDTKPVSNSFWAVPYLVRWR